MKMSTKKKYRKSFHHACQGMEVSMFYLGLSCRSFTTNCLRVCCVDSDRIVSGAIS